MVALIILGGASNPVGLVASGNLVDGGGCWSLLEL